MKEKIIKKRESMPKIHERFVGLLKEGKERAILMNDLMSVLNIQDRRQAYQIVEDLINKYHYPIGANRSGEHRGYFIISNEDELKEVVAVQRASVESEQKKIDNTIRNFRYKGAVYELTPIEKIKELLKTIVIVIDTKKQPNEHILEYLNAMKIQYVYEELDHGDYGAYLPRNERYNIIEDSYINVTIEVKRSIEELADTLTSERFESRYFSSTRLVVGGEESYRGIIYGFYDHELSPQEMLQAIGKFNETYETEIQFVDNDKLGEYVFSQFYHAFAEYLKDRMYFR